ncbi:MAG: 1-acyl-sn-glycerol-3-phosphate acyltransferase [Pyrinomonadaceae bacterium]|nr:1-acyl-sn-glycerol-3-phosphate acyltransferase [Pyrinomonadaceae bacterium]
MQAQTRKQIDSSSAKPQDFALSVKNNKKIRFPVQESTKSRVRGKLRYWWSWLVVATIVLFIATPVMIFYRFRKKRDGFFTWCDWGSRIWLKACGVKVNASGKENLEEGRQYVFVSNHRSYLDTATLYAFAGRRVGLVAKKELLKVPIFGYGMAVANVIAIDRSNPERAKNSMEKARQIMDDGYSFGVFAEGTRAMPGELLPFKKGAIHLALQTNAPIIPVVFKNTDQLMGKRTGVAYPGTIEMVLLPAIETDGSTAENDLMRLLNESREAVANELAKGRFLTE